MTTTTQNDESITPSALADLPKVRVSLEGVDGNALSLIGAWRNAARRQGWAEADIDAVSDKALSGTYEYVIRTLLSHSASPDEDDAE
jgi:hypothetical protein